MKKNFRFFDNRQKYLLFVTTTNEKNKIADNLKPIIQSVKPNHPALKIFDAGMGRRISTYECNETVSSKTT